jgi:hypothetical protein
MIAELVNYLERLEDLRSQMSGLIAELPIEALNWRPIISQDDHSTNSLAVLAAHSAGAEHYWFSEVIDNGPRTRNRDAELATVAIHPKDIIQILENVARETREIFSRLGEAELDGTRRVNEREVPVRWCVLHIVDHTSLHLGHMQITYQLWSGGKSFASPLWFERLPKK